MAKDKSSTTKAIKLCTALITLAEEYGLQINITIPPHGRTVSTAKQPAVPKKPTEDAIKKRKREDLAWLQSHLTQHSGELMRLSGHYVAVYQRRIVSVGGNEKLVCLSAAESTHVTPQEILVIPIEVRSSDAEEDWRQVQYELGLS